MHTDALRAGKVVVTGPAWRRQYKASAYAALYAKSKRPVKERFHRAVTIRRAMALVNAEFRHIK